VTHDESARRVTSGRLPLASRTLPVFVDHPLAGVGIGAQPWASSQREGAKRRESRNTSHTTPFTVAAELGLLGLAAYGAFLFGAARGAFLVRRREQALGLALVATLTVLAVHSLFYSGFFEDPLTWLVPGLAGSCLAVRGGAPPRGALPP
jgi:O-antigen ligase